MTSSRDAYKVWSVRDAGVEAPKVEVLEKDNGERGLFATETIFPQERFLFLPQTASIGKGMLRKRGSEILARGVDSFDLDKATGAEEWAIGVIEEIRRLTTGEDDSAVKSAAQNAQYEWKSDDAVALYLLACRAIMQRGKASSVEIVGRVATEASTQLIPEGMTQYPAPVVDDIHQDSEQVTSLIKDASHCSPEALVMSLNEVSLEEEEQTQSSPSFLPHVAMLPESFPTSPLYYSSEEMARLEGTNCHGYTVRMLNQIESDWAQLAHVLRAYFSSLDRRMKCKHCRDGTAACKCQILLDTNTAVTLESYKWAMCNIYSRSTDFAFFGQGGQEEYRRMIAPVFDMMNHSSSSHVTHSMDVDGT